MASQISEFQRQALEKDWQFRDGSNPTEEWMPVAKVPSVVHLDLMEAGKSVLRPEYDSSYVEN